MHKVIPRTKFSRFFPYRNNQYEMPFIKAIIETGRVNRLFVKISKLIT